MLKITYEQLFMSNITPNMKEICKNEKAYGIKVWKSLVKSIQYLEIKLSSLSVNWTFNIIVKCVPIYMLRLIKSS